MRILVVYQYKYQSNQFDNFFSELKSTYNHEIVTAYRELDINIRSRSSIKEFLVSRQFDVVLYTGMPSRNLHTICKELDISLIQLPHSLVGTSYDLSLAYSSEVIYNSYIPSYWDSPELKYSSYHKCNFYPIAYNSIVSEKVPKKLLHKKVLGICLGENGNHKEVSNYLKSNYHEFDTIYSKFHKLTDLEIYDMYQGIPNLVIIPTDIHPYDYINKCNYIIGGYSTLFYESILRSIYYNLDVKYMISQKPRDYVDLLDKFGDCNVNHGNHWLSTKELSKFPEFQIPSNISESIIEFNNYIVEVSNNSK